MFSVANTDVLWTDLPDGSHWIARVTCRLGEDLVVNAVVLEQHGNAVVSELRVARKPRRSLPSGGISPRQLRHVKTGPIIAAARASATRLAGDSPAARRELAGLLDAEPQSRGGRPRMSDEQLLEVARRYADLVASEEKHPNQVIARELHVTPGRVRDLILRCRKRELLTPAIHGRAEGRLTPYAEALSRNVNPATGAPPPIGS